MSLGIFALLLAAVGAGWLLWNLGRGESAAGSRNMTTLKGVVWLLLAAALFAAKLWPLAFMVLIAAGGVAAIEMWRARTITEQEASSQPAKTPAKTMDADEAAALLGVAPDASAEDIRAAHRKLISQTHPDHGGTDYLAAKINEARDFLLARLE
jgi:hypothetical protein